METKRILSTSDPLFGQLWGLYENSFPRVERRTTAHQQTAFGSPQYRMNAYTEDERLAGLIGYWEFPEYTYVEHLAVNPELRSGGYGSRIMKELIATARKPVILEIEPVEDEMTQRRLNFYERLGFHSNPYRHPQHAYHDDDPADFMLTILSYPDPLPTESYERFNNDLRKIVMRKE